MPVVNVEDLVRLQRKPEDIRNVSSAPPSHLMSRRGYTKPNIADLHSSPRCKFPQKDLDGFLNSTSRIMMAIYSPLNCRTTAKRH